MRIFITLIAFVLGGLGLGAVMSKKPSEPQKIEPVTEVKTVKEEPEMIYKPEPKKKGKQKDPDFMKAISRKGVEARKKKAAEKKKVKKDELPS